MTSSSFVVEVVAGCAADEASIKELGNHEVTCGDKKITINF